MVVALSYKSDKPFVSAVSQSTPTLPPESPVQLQPCALAWPVAFTICSPDTSDVLSAVHGWATMFDALSGCETAGALVWLVLLVGSVVALVVAGVGVPLLPDVHPVNAAAARSKPSTAAYGIRAVTTASRSPVGTTGQR